MDKARLANQGLCAKLGQMSERQSKLEWISLVYLAFFVLAVFSPSIFTGGAFGLSETMLEELTIFFFGIAGLITFTLYERLMEKREKEQEQVLSDYHRAKTELIESYAYIGSVNRKIELLKRIANDASKQLKEPHKRIPKELFQALAANACAACGAKAALIRFVDLEKLRTDKEFLHQGETNFIFRVPNRELRSLSDQGVTHGVIRSEDGREVLVVPSDHAGGDRKAHLLLWLNEQGINEIDTSLLKVFVNQAEALYKNLSGIKEEAPKMLVEAQEDEDTYTS